MTLQECTALLAPVALACRADFDEPTFRAYHAVLKDVPAMLMEAAIQDLQTSGLRFVPTAPEFLASSERQRRRLLALHPWDGCADCEDQRGYRTRIGEAGQKTVERCPCRARHASRLTDMGIAEPLALLPGEAGVGESEKIYPTAAQLPEPIRVRLQSIANQKQLR